MNVQNSESVGSSIAIAMAILAVRLGAVEAAFQRAKRTASGFRFPAGFGTRMTLRFGGLFGMFIGYKMDETATTPFNIGVSLLVAFLGLACILMEPGEIFVTPEGLVQTFWFGLKKRRIAWEGAAASYDPVLREVLVVGSEGTTMAHTNYHVGQSEFLFQLKKHKIYVQYGTGTA
ncbi:hypothetical protein [Bryobacter aggregatus]|uniref:hypothetical protein n=1 Tax=Bryobacter aggregatus TaxID=360054 RepID=UPI0004E1EF63|nr:hypothetical protein [Bryobacter aggregatus]